MLLGQTGEFPLVGAGKSCRCGGIGRGWERVWSYKPGVEAVSAVRRSVAEKSLETPSNPAIDAAAQPP